MARRNKSPRRAASSLKRRPPFREPKRRFILFCEGQNTEPAYFAAIRRVYRSALIKIDIVDGVGDAKKVAERAAKRAHEEGLSKARRKKKDSYEEDDQVWAVFDVDNLSRSHIAKAVTLCESNKVGVARSNPCFELWLILHKRDYEEFGTNHDVQKAFQKTYPKYDRNGAKIPNELISCMEEAERSYVEDAEKRSEAQLQQREKDGAPFGNPSTTVGRLTRAIREADGTARLRG